MADSPSIYYRLGDAANSTTAADSSGHGSDGAVTNTVSFGTPGALLNDTAATFGAGEVQEASGAGLPTGNADRSIELWFHTTSTDHQVLAWWGSDAPNQEMELGVNGGNEIYWTGEYSEADFTTPTSFADGAWHHLVVTYTGSSLTTTAYLDGVPIGTHVLGGPWNTTLDATGLTVGGPQYQGYFFAGDLDEFAIYPAALSAAQVAAHYAASGHATPTGPGSVGTVAVNAGSNAVAAAWNAPSGPAVDYYRVSAVDPVGNEATSTVVPGSATTAVLTGLPAGPGWTVQVVAVNGLGASAPSASGTFTVTGTSTSYASQVLTDSPVIYYRLADGAGAPSAADSSGNGRDGAVSNTVAFGQPGALATEATTAAGFGSGEVELASGAGLPTGNGDRSIEAWFKTSNTGQQVLTWWGTSAPNEQMELGINGGNQIYWTGEYNEADFTSPTSFADNSWHHLVVTYDGTSRTAVGYLDGTMLGSHVLGSDWNTTLDGTGLMVGGPEYQGYFFHGDLADVAVYGSVLSPARVLAHYSAARLAGLATTTYSYDGAGRKASETDPDGHATSYGYDANGNQTSLTDAMGRVTTQTFDADNRLTAITYNDGTTPNVTYTYDAAGRRTSMVDGTGTSHYTYNTAKQLTSVTDGAGDSVGYGYDALGRISSITYPGGHQVSRGYDANSRLASVTDWNNHANTFGYDGDGNLVSTTYGNGITETSNVDAADQISGIAIANSGGTLASFGYTYTPGGQVASVTDSLAPTPTNTYGYSANNQLEGQNGDPTAYGYDGADNITGLDTGDALTYDAGGRLQTDQPAAGAAPTTYGYDADGDRTTANTGATNTTYSYDQASRLTSYAGPTVTSTYAYDGDGLRASVTGDGAQTDTWDAATAGLPLLLSDGTEDYLYGPNDQVVEQIDELDDTTMYLQRDQLGSIRLLTDQTGAILGTTSYDAYGRTLTQTGSATTFGYTGEQTDPTGLIYLRARYYDPVTASLLTVDPAVMETRESYSYANTDPTRFKDPSGMTNQPVGDASGSFSFALEYTYGQIKMNASSKLIERMRCFNLPSVHQFFFSDCAIDPAGFSENLWTFVRNFETGGKWDPKPFLRKALGGDGFMPTPNGRYNIYYDIWGNVEYGYVAKEAGFDDYTVMHAQSATGLYAPLRLLKHAGVNLGATDAGDNISVSLGIDLYKKYSLKRLTPGVIQSAITSAIPRYLAAGAMQVQVVPTCGSTQGRTRTRAT